MNDTSPDAYERLIDRLLDSTRYAERMTLMWMDAARYGDTSVFHADGPRDMWPWRDWVLNAYATNMPFDQFTLEQLAGDLLDDPTNEQLVATGFNRNHGTTDEGGAIDEEYRVEYIVDRIKTTSMVWLGLTMECAQCHDHKYDPISQRDYYRFFAYFNQTPEKGMQTRNGNAEPRVMVPSDRQQRRLATMDAAVLQAQSQFDQAVPSEEEFLAWVRRRRSGGAELNLGAWSRLGPFSGDSVKEVFEKDFGPEKSVDLKKTYDALKWEPQEEWKDGEVVSFGYQTPNSATYVYRTIAVKEPTQLELSLGSDDTITVWHNRKRVLRKQTSRGAAPDQESLNLKLVPGKNELLLKICNGSGPTGFYFSTKGTRLPEDLEQVVKLPDADWSPVQRASLTKHFKANVWLRGQELTGQITEAKKQRDEFAKVVPTVMVMRNMPEPRMTYVLNRGSYDAPMKDKPVQAGPPAFLPELGEANVNSRLGLAQWLIHPDHPLTARVAVNRYWTLLFGRGIVTTVADFGSQGAWPSHPELLDYLASDFVASGWNVKRMLREIMTSHTYRQASTVTSRHLEVDPLNTYLARAPRFRLAAEFIRDNALTVAGLLVERVGGPGVKPYQPPGLWNEVSLSGNVRFQRDEGQKLYRRTMYTYWKRSSPQPAMMAFDVPTREKCVIQRQRTNTPLQALVTLNDTQYVEAARCFAQRILQQASIDKDVDRLDMAFELATGRTADSTRRELLLDLLQAERRHFSSDRDSATSLLAVGEAPRDSALDAVDHAAWTVVTSAILNLDETLNKE